MDKDALTAEMNRLRDELKQAQRDGLIDYKAMSKDIDMNETYIQQFVTKGSPKIMHAHMVERVRQMLAGARKSAPSRPKPSDRKVSGQDAYALLERIDIIPPGDGERAYALLRTVWGEGGVKPPLGRVRDQPEPASRPHESVPSRRQPQRSTS